MEGDLHIVDFEKWCATCENRDKAATDEPCDSCLTVPARPNSRKPERWKEKTK